MSNWHANWAWSMPLIVINVGHLAAEFAIILQGAKRMRADGFMFGDLSLGCARLPPGSA
jgi:hypothetical protein